MKKANLLSRAEMRKVMGGIQYYLDVQQLVETRIIGVNFVIYGCGPQIAL